MTNANANLYSLLSARFASAPEAPALELDDGRRYTYRDLDAESARYASLLTSLGLERGDRVAAQIDKSPQAIFLYLGCLRAGYVYLPLNTAYQTGEIAFFLGDAEPRVRAPTKSPTKNPMSPLAQVEQSFTPTG